MIDKNDKHTIDAFVARRPGRPKTTTAEAKREQGRKRAAKHYEKKRNTEKCIRFCAKKMMDPKLDSFDKKLWQSFTLFLNGIGDGGSPVKVLIDNKKTDDIDHVETDYEGLRELIIQDAIIIKIEY